MKQITFTEHLLYAGHYAKWFICTLTCFQASVSFGSVIVSVSQMRKAQLREVK